MQDINLHQIPPGGWQFRVPQTGWVAPAPVNNTFGQQVVNIIKHRAKNPAICAKHNLSTEPDAVGAELLEFNRKRLGIPVKGPAPSFQPARSIPARVAAAAGDIKRAAQGTAVVLDWLTSGGAPVAQAKANERARACVGCVHNVEGSWFTTAPAELIRETLEARKDLKLVTPFDTALKSCSVCLCLNRLKVWCPISHILKRTKPEIMAEFPPNCWIAKERNENTGHND